jgi:hypothetical protein
LNAATVNMRKLLFVFLFLYGITAGVLGQTPGLTSSGLWKPAQVPFSFEYGGKQSAEFLRTWHFTQEQAAAGSSRLIRYEYLDPATKLRVTAEVRLYREYPGVVDWVLRFRNEGSSDTPLIENILPLHWTIPASPGECLLRHDRGSDAKAEDFQPLEERFPQYVREGSESGNEGEGTGSPEDSARGGAWLYAGFLSAGIGRVRLGGLRIPPPVPEP